MKARTIQTGTQSGSPHVWSTWLLLGIFLASGATSLVYETLWARQLHLVVEGGGAVGLAALLQGKVAPRAPDGAVAVVVSGGNVGPGTLAELAERRS